MTIENIRNLQDLAEICAELVKHGVTFKAERTGMNGWTITLTGGY